MTNTCMLLLTFSHSFFHETNKTRKHPANTSLLNERESRKKKDTSEKKKKKRIKVSTRKKKHTHTPGIYASMAWLSET